MADAERVLRDHSEKCDHDTDWYWEGTPERRIYLCNVSECPGGREVTIDDEAMSEAVIALRKKPWGYSVHDGMTILDAALGRDS